METTREQNELDRSNESKRLELVARLRNIDGAEIARINAELRQRDADNGISVVSRLHRAQQRADSE